MERFRDKRDTIDSFRDEFLVRCPSCDSCATVRRIPPEKADCFDCFVPHKFSCTACGSSKDWSEAIVRLRPSEPVDDYFHYSLGLKAPCCGQMLWAYNLRHLELIEAFVGAKLRERKPDEQYGWSNSSLFSRFPKWMQSRKNQEAILKAIAKIREKGI